MKILYIPSGYGQIYQSFDLSILQSINQLNHQVRSIPFSEEETLKNVVHSFQPDIALTLTGFNMPYTMIEWIKKQGVKLVVWMTEDPYYIDRSLKLIHDYDYVFTIDTAALKVYKEAGHKEVYYLPLGTDPDIYHPTALQKQYQSDICLVGSPYPDRMKIIQYLLEKTNYSIQVVGRQWEKKLIKAKRSSRLSIHSHWIPPSIAKHYFNSAAINLNTHRPFHLKQNKNIRAIINQSINNRTFDIASSGAFQLIEYKPDLHLHFTEGEEMVSFKSSEDLLKKVKYYMSHLEERKKISERARKKVLSNDTFIHRINKMMNIIN
ncbi:CgeB family protein [Halalkalibacter alkalisediminis]|uniref:Glycosyltransferase n=1 Tax=Halalkalibacter alkalisediminis TaxID=935616 RepID=A0ABV6NNR6_9BACI|nr:glycosyltransferase [Halalkalibacter alkalisediminis]